VETEICETGASPGEMQSDGKTYLKFAASNGWISVRELQQEGKKRMQVEEYLRGNPFKTI
jgi:methionyl-tRNA formyltransferase